ncbi:DUF2491 family protein [Zavarzinia aquatilis]|uniref:DUF2491 domain-containing protein n=1 Tax=Zavarzinia aquatilis TaxID=2211142 RepID=A0A317DXE4_9PROT|nr:DUF2491 family protein [Zavarzinia aquatilis]PWR19408.1 DUF2491 domain-containing protein [Zavarzinia aquatilis]
MTHVDNRGRGRRLLSLVLAAVLGLGPVGAGLSAPTIRLATGIAVTALWLGPGASDAEAKRRGGSSGGYSRPGSGSSSGYSRTPSFGGGSSSSGGYTRPGSGGSSSGSWGGSSAGSDRSASRSQSRDALDDFLSPAPSRTPSTRDSGSTAGSGSWGDYGSAPAPRRRTTTDYYGSRGYRTPDYAYGGRSSFGVFDAVMLWFLLDTLSDRGHADFFRDNRDDPGYREWRAEADKAAATDPALKAKLDALDAQLAAAPGDPSRAGQLPADVAPPPSSGGGFGLVIALLILGVILFMIVKNLRQSTTGAGPAGKVSDVKQTIGGNGSALGSAAAILRNKMSGAVYRPDLFRVGMPLTLDPTPFILAEGLTKVAAPKAATDNGMIGVDAVGTLTDKGGTYHRLYLEDEGAFFQLVLDAQGFPSECRYFRQFDEVQPADRDEWSFWLGKEDGMIGWPEFETKDGKLYKRVWSPGPNRVPPREMQETREDLNGKTEVGHSAMLYARTTGGKAPAPETEYLLVTAVRGAGEAYVALHAGIDINPSALSLS